MNRPNLKILLVLLLPALLISNNALAEIFYENNFDAGTMPKYHPDPEQPGQTWTLAQPFPEVYGDNNHFNLSTTSAHSGTHSLRFTYEARNGFCNTCGTVFQDFSNDKLKHIASGHDGVSYFIDDGGFNLSISDNPNTTTKPDDGPKALPGRFVYNRDGGYSLWQISSVASHNANSDRLNMTLVKPGTSGETTINSGDNIAIARQCGVDGIIGLKTVDGVSGNDINRRSDCNSVIMWFGNVNAQPEGSSIFRRQYLKAELTSQLGVRQKLHYFRPDRDGPFQGEAVLFGQTTTTKDVQVELSGLSRYGAPQNIYKAVTAPEFVGLNFERGKWYYIQEEYKAATVLSTDVSGNATAYRADGEYRLWFSESGSEPAQGSPTFELTGLTLPPLSGGLGTHISFWGNTQHDTHNRGGWYIDDVLITDTFNPPVTKSGPADVLPPDYPTVNK